ncbi:multicopper oxidase domain-containing protein [uncultured Jannaschia sp.]|uniref:multicopper oxidase domain-containing protein n=1 Tax=uncultured Jannaschia sp. TaxID=293347 RepID=UPI00262282CD|nr:multicopper oxidase domain-containing protein [uncultured Jannaschia sp.]
MDRRTLLGSLSAMGATGLLAGCTPPSVASRPMMFTADAASGADGALRSPTGPQSRYDITVGRTRTTVGRVTRNALTFNGTVPGPLVHLREDDDVTLNVTNRLNESTSIHWHGLLVPFEMDGVPGVNFPGIPPGETFTYRFRVKNQGTYWYHSHSGFQEQEGLYGAMIIDPADGREPYSYDRDVVMVLSDWPDRSPEFIYSRLKKAGAGYYNYQKRTFGDFVEDVGEEGLLPTLRDRTAWAEMGMIPSDLLNVTDAGYTYAANGASLEQNWTALFTPGERVRVRVINASAMTHYDVRVPGRMIDVIAVHGQYVEAVRTHEFRIGVAETYDFIVTLPEDRAYTVFAESLNRSGATRITLAPRTGMSGPVPALRPRPLRDLSKVGMGGMDDSLLPSGGQEPMENMPPAPDVNVAMRVMEPQSRLDEPGVGLGDDGWPVLTYSQLRALYPRYDRAPEREIVINLTSNMERYIFSFNGDKFSNVDRIQFYLGERLRLTLMNQSMMSHPIHLHGMWMELENGHGDRIPRMHTVMVKPGERLSMLITPVELGDWAFHCHLLYHFHSGMFRVVNVALKELASR